MVSEHSFRAVRKGDTLHVVVGGPTSLSQILDSFEVTPEPLLSMGAVYVNRRRLSEAIPLRAGDYVRFHLRPKRFCLDEIDWSSLVKASFPDFLIVDKPARLPVHATLDNVVENLETQLSLYRGEKLYSTHRLDQPTQGLLVLARNPAAVAQFHRWLRRHQVKKYYRVLTQKEVLPGNYVHYLKPSAHGRKELSDLPLPGYVRCELNVLSGIKRPEGFEGIIELVTGRTHQIRAQLAMLGAPIPGDELYGGPAFPYLALQSFELTFPISHPQYFHRLERAPWRTDE